MERMRQYQKGSFKGMTTAERKDRYIKDVGEQAYNKAYDKAFEKDRNSGFGSRSRGYIPYKLTSESDKVAKPIALAARKSAVTKGSDRFDQVTRYDDMLGRATNPYKYQPGGMRMYGDPKLGDQTFANIVYQESEAGKEEALKKQMQEAQADNTAMEEANAALQRQYSIGNRIEASGQTALQAGAKGLLRLAEDPLKGQTPDWASAMIPNAAGETASLASGTPAAAATDAATGALTDAATDAAGKGAGKLGAFASKYVNKAHAKAVSPYAIGANLLGRGINYLSNDDDATTLNFGEGFGSTLQSAGAGAGYGSILGPVGTAVGAGVGALYGLGKGIYQRNKARNTIGAAEDEKTEELNRIGAEMRNEGIKSRSYSGYDFGRTLAKHGGPRMYQAAGFDMSMLANNPIKNVPASRQDVLTGYSDAELKANRAKGNEVAFNNRMNTVGDNLYSAGQYIKENPLDAAQVGLGGIAIGADGIPVIGTAVSGIADGINAGISGTRSAYYANKGDTAKAGFYGMAAGLDGLAAVPGVGNAAGATKMGMLLNKASHLAHGPIHVAHQGAKAITAGKAALLGVDAATNSFKKGGVKLPGGTMNPIPGSDAVEFKGKSHKQGGILLDEQTEVEGGETMDKVTMKNEGPSDYFFSKYLKLGGQSFAQRHKQLLKEGGTQQDIDSLAQVQEKVAGRNPGVVQMERGGVRQYQSAGPRLDETGRLVDMRYPYLTNSMYQDIENFKPGYFNPPVYGPNRPPKAAQSAPVDISSVGNFYTPMNPALPNYQITMGVPELQLPGSGNQVDYLAGIKPRKEKAAQQREDVNLYDSNLNNPTEPQDKTYVDVNTTLPPLSGGVPSVMGLLQKEPSGYFRSTPGNFGKLGEYENAPLMQVPADEATVAENTPATSTAGASKTSDSEQTARQQETPVTISPKSLPKVDNTTPVKPEIVQQIQELEAKKETQGLTDDERKALKKLYRDVPLGAYAAGAAQMLPAAYAFLRKEKAQKLMGPAGRIGSPKLDRVDFNKERSQNASDARALNKSIETSGSGPAGIIAKMAAFGRKQKGDMEIAVGESRANAGIQAQEAQMKQQADSTNVQNALAIDNVNTQMMENQRVADENRKYMALDKLANASSGLMGDVMSYKANERMARAIGSMGIYEREKLLNSMLGKTNPRTGKPYNRNDIAELYNISLEDNNLLQEAESAKTKSEK